MSALPRPQGLLLDLDGTLIDSAPDIAEALSEVLAAHSLPPLTPEAVRPLIGHGIARLVERAFADAGASLDPDALAAAQAAMGERYSARLTCATTLLPGARELVAHCQAHGIALACVTNKPAAMARTILDHFGIGVAIGVLIGGDSGIARKPAPDPLLAAIDRLGLSPSEVWMVGDGLPDMLAARAAGITAIAVASEYGEPFDAGDYALLSVSSLSALCTILAHLESVSA